MHKVSISKSIVDRVVARRGREHIFDDLVPAKTPKDVITLLNREIAAAVAPPEVQERLTTLGFETATATPEELASFLKAEIPKWAAVIQAAGIKAN